MKKIPKNPKLLTADEIAEEAMSGKDISKYFTGKGRMMPGIRRVNVDFSEPMLNELDDVVVKMNQDLRSPVFGPTLSGHEKPGGGQGRKEASCLNR